MYWGSYLCNLIFHTREMYWGSQNELVINRKFTNSSVDKIEMKTFRNWYSLWTECMETEKSCACPSQHALTIIRHTCRKYRNKDTIRLVEDSV